LVRPGRFKILPVSPSLVIGAATSWGRGCPKSGRNGAEVTPRVSLPQQRLPSHWSDTQRRRVKRCSCGSVEIDRLHPASRQSSSSSDETMGQPMTLVAHSTPPRQHRPNKLMWPPFFVTPGRGTKPYWALHSEGHTWLARLGELLVGAAVVGCALRPIIDGRLRTCMHARPPMSTRRSNHAHFNMGCLHGTTLPRTTDLLFKACPFWVIWDWHVDVCESFWRISRTNTTIKAAFHSRIPMSGRHSTWDGGVVMDPSLAGHGHDKRDCRRCCPAPTPEVGHSDAENGALREAARPRAQEHSVRHVSGQRAATQSAFTACGGPCSDDGCYAQRRTARDNQGARNQGVSTAALVQRRGKFPSHWKPLVGTYTGRSALEGCPGSRHLGHYT